VVVTKSGQHTDGLERCFSSLDGQVVPGLSFLRLSLLRVKRRTSSPVMREPREQQPTATPQEGSEKQSHGKRGRPTGSHNQPRRDVALSPYRRVVQETIQRLRGVIGAHCQGMYFVFDGAFGHHDAPQMVRQLGAPLLAKRR